MKAGNCKGRALAPLGNSTPIFDVVIVLREMQVDLRWSRRRNVERKRRRWFANRTGIKTPSSFNHNYSLHFHLGPIRVGFIVVMAADCK